MLFRHYDLSPVQLLESTVIYSTAVRSYTDALRVEAVTIAQHPHVIRQVPICNR